MVQVKTFHGDRRTFRFEVKINEKLCDLIPKICMEEDKIFSDSSIRDPNSIKGKKLNYANQYRMFSSLGFVKELNILKTFREEEIKTETTILILDPVRLNFSEINRGSMIYLQNKNLIASKQGGDEHQIVLTEQGYSISKHYCEFVLLTEPYERSVIIGLSLKRSDFNINSNDMKGFYGFILSECKKVSQGSNNKVELVEYGDLTKMGDRVGILMEFLPTGLDVSFFINKINMGVAFKSLPLNTYYPSVILGYDGTRVRITNNVEFPDV
jgi:hypothetical protein